MKLVVISASLCFYTNRRGSEAHAILAVIICILYVRSVGFAVKQIAYKLAFIYLWRSKKYEFALRAGRVVGTRTVRALQSGYCRTVGAAGMARVLHLRSRRAGSLTAGLSVSRALSRSSRRRGLYDEARSVPPRGGDADADSIRVDCPRGSIWRRGAIRVRWGMSVERSRRNKAGAAGQRASQ